MRSTSLITACLNDALFIGNNFTDRSKKDHMAHALLFASTETRKPQSPHPADQEKKWRSPRPRSISRCEVSAPSLRVRSVTSPRLSPDGRFQLPAGATWLRLPSSQRLATWVPSCRNLCSPSCPRSDTLSSAQQRGRCCAVLSGDSVVAYGVSSPLCESNEAMDLIYDKT